MSGQPSKRDLLYPQRLSILGVWLRQEVGTDSLLKASLLQPLSASAAFCRHTWRFINLLIIIFLTPGYIIKRLTLR